MCLWHTASGVHWRFEMVVFHAHFKISIYKWADLMGFKYWKWRYERMLWSHPELDPLISSCYINKSPYRISCWQTVSLNRITLFPLLTQNNVLEQTFWASLLSAIRLLSEEEGQLWHYLGLWWNAKNCSTLSWNQGSMYKSIT